MLAILMLLGVASASAGSFVSRDGAIDLPEDFRATMTHLGSWYVPDGPASGFHDVYATPRSVKHYREHGEFPDGAVVVKELRAGAGGTYTTGADVQHAGGDIKQWFVMIKDREGRFDGNALWGDGWGWGLFKPDQPQVNVATDYRNDCLGCHLPARSNDLIYVEAYPTLKP